MKPVQFIKIVFSYPPTWLVIITLLSLHSALHYWFQPSILFDLAVSGINLLLFALWGMILIKSGTIGQIYYTMINRINEEDWRSLEKIEADLKQLEFKQGIQQLHMLREKLSSLTEVMQRRLQAGELTYGRYLGSAEQVYLAAVDNLHDIAVALKSVSTIDEDYIKQRLGELHHNQDDVETLDQNEIETLKKRAELLKSQQKKIRYLVTQNETAMTVLDKTATALADTKTQSGHATMGVQEAMAELEVLAKQAGKYAVR
ncbi:hypothetical protein ACQZV8_00505 [Magnetococcales bacterium HHB-1]